ncbi:MAG: glycosyltransferase [Bacteroidales bacterium]|nr:glycosyltransferase [Bacteroidales bacterium]
MNSKLSIITINLNNKIGLEKTIKSVITQTFNEIEYIIIDGGSNDGSIEIIRNYNVKNKFIWLSEPDRGIFHAMNKGIKMASGEYLLFLNSGDTLVDNSVLEKVLRLNICEDYVFGNFNIEKKGKVIYKDVCLEYEEPSLYNLIDGSLPHQASFIKKKLFTKYGLYDENLKYSGDWEFCIRTIILNNCSIKHIQITTTNYDIEGISSVYFNLAKEEKIQILDRFFPKRLITDFLDILEIKNEYNKISWYRQHPIFYYFFNLMYKIGKKIVIKQI